MALMKKRVKKHQSPKRHHSGIQLQGHVGKQLMHEAVRHHGAQAWALANHQKQVIKKKGRKTCR